MINRHKIGINSVKFSSTIRLFDPNGRVFFYKGGVYRAIYKHRVSFIKKLFNDGIVELLSEPSPTEVGGFFAILQQGG